MKRYYARYHSKIPAGEELYVVVDGDANAQLGDPRSKHSALEEAARLNQEPHNPVEPHFNWLGGLSMTP